MIQFLLALSLLPQAPVAAQSQAADWDARPHIDRLNAAVSGVKTVLDQIHPAEWAAKGAPDGYAKQLQDCKTDTGYVQDTLARWAAQPDRLSLMLESLGRIESLSQYANSLSQGVRRYQNPAVADLLDGQLPAMATDLAWLRAQALDLAQQREKELEVAQKEAQRCRTQIFQSPRPVKK